MRVPDWRANGNPIATISVVKYGEAFGFLGLYIVRPEFLGMGYGLEIWTAGLNSLGDRKHRPGWRCRPAGQLHEVRIQVGAPEHALRGTQRWGGHGMRGHRGLVLVSLPGHRCLRPCFFPEARSAFLRRWIGQPGAHALGIRSGGELAGYGVIRAPSCGMEDWALVRGWSRTGGSKERGVDVTDRA